MPCNVVHDDLGQPLVVHRFMTTDYSLDCDSGDHTYVVMLAFCCICHTHPGRRPPTLLMMGGDPKSAGMGCAVLRT